MRLYTLGSALVGSLLGSAWVADQARGADLLIVLNKSEDTASLLDGKSGAARATIAVGHAPHEVAVLVDGKTAVVSNYGTREEAGHSLTLIDLAKASAIGTIELGEGTRPHGLWALSDGRLLVTAEGKKELLVVDPKARRVLARVPTGRETSHMVAASSDGRRAYVANIGSGSVTVLDLVAAKVIKDIPTGAGAEGIDISPDDREIWVTNRAADTVSIIDTRALSIAASLKAAQFPIRIKITPDGKRALVSCARSGDVAVFDTQGRRELKRISIEREAVPGSGDRLFSTQFGKSPVPVGLLIAPDSKRAWVASTNADVVSTIDLGTLTVVGRLSAGKEPDGLAGLFEPAKSSSPPAPKR